MPITPEQASRGTDSIYENEYTYHVKEIDKMLASGGRTYDLGHMSGPVTARILREYVAVGWNIRQRTDFRDGDYLEFTDPRSEGWK